jgi:membrane protease YdiL (CAAX protease family)
MKFLQEAFRNLHPILQFFFLVSVMVVGMAASVFVGTYVSAVVCGTENSLPSLIKVMGNIQSDEGICATLALNSINQILAFGGLAFVYIGLYGSGVGVGFHNLGRSDQLGKFIIGAVVLTVAFGPFLDLTYRINEWMLIEGSAIHSMAAALELEAARVTEAMLQMGTTGKFLATLVAVAVLPAVCEELAFRGALQPLFAKWSGNVHVGIWVSAALFSAIHFQFFGFLPRLLLGAGFGYLVYASGSLWPAIVGHFVNNATAVTAAWYLGPEWIHEGMNPSEGVWDLSEWGTAAVFAIVLVFGISKLKGLSVASENKARYLARGL